MKSLSAESVALSVQQLSQEQGPLALALWFSSTGAPDPAGENKPMHHVGECDCRQWDILGKPPAGRGFHRTQHPTAFRKITQAILRTICEALTIGILILEALFFCAAAPDARSAEPSSAQAAILSMIMPLELARWIQTAQDPCFPFGKDARGRPIYPISHRRDGQLITGTADAFGGGQ